MAAAILQIHSLLYLLVLEEDDLQRREGQLMLMLEWCGSHDGQVCERGIVF